MTSKNKFDTLFYIFDNHRFPLVTLIIPKYMCTKLQKLTPSENVSGVPTDNLYEWFVCLFERADLWVALISDLKNYFCIN